MPLNLIKQYSDLLEIAHLNEQDRIASLRRIFNKDIQDNAGFNFRAKIIRPVIKEGNASMDTLFNHLISGDVLDKKGKKTGARDFERDRSIRLHWVRHHIEERKQENVHVFSFIDRINSKNVPRTYIFDRDQSYVIVLEPQNSGLDYYLITAYYLNQDYGINQINKKLDKKLDEVL